MCLIFNVVCCFPLSHLIDFLELVYSVHYACEIYICFFYVVYLCVYMCVHDKFQKSFQSKYFKIGHSLKKKPVVC